VGVAGDVEHGSNRVVALTSEGYPHSRVSLLTLRMLVDVESLTMRL
jgi:hypothetical protein